MTLRDQIATDLPVFLNVDEFADSIEIDGATVACVVEGNGDTPASSEGVTDQDVLIYARAADFEKIPVIGQRLTVGDAQAQVVGVSEDQGILILRTRWWDS